jgi:thioesterase domain-containing protein
MTSGNLQRSRSHSEHDPGVVADLLQHLSLAARSRAVFDVPSDETRKAVKISKGPAPHRLIAFPAPLALCGPQQYARFARSLRGVRDMMVLTVPGFVGKERLPATLRVAIAHQAQAIQRAADGRPVVLAGYSTGGTFAYGVASYLESIDAPVAAVVLLDTYPMGKDTAVSAQLEALLMKLFSNPEWRAYLNDTRLTAMGWYTQMIIEWELEAIRAPTLLVRSREPMPGVSVHGEWQAVWPFPHDTVAVAGDHYTMMEEHADATAGAVEQWLSAKFAAPIEQ